MQLNKYITKREEVNKRFDQRSLLMQLLDFRNNSFRDLCFTSSVLNWFLSPLQAIHEYLNKHANSTRYKVVTCSCCCCCTTQSTWQLVPGRLGSVAAVCCAAVHYSRIGTIVKASWNTPRPTSGRGKAAAFNLLIPSHSL